MTATMANLDDARLAAEAAQVRGGMQPALVGMAAVAAVLLFIARAFAGIADPDWFVPWLALMALPPLALGLAAGATLVRRPDDAETVRIWLPFGRVLRLWLNIGVILSQWVLLPAAEPLLRALMLMLYAWFMATEVLVCVDSRGLTWVALLGVPLSLGVFLIGRGAAYAVPVTLFLALIGASLFVLEQFLIRVRSRAFAVDEPALAADSATPDSAVPDSVAPLLVPSLPGDHDVLIDATPRSGLTTRQIEVLRLLAGGLSNKEVARRLGVSPATIKTHVAQVIAITGSANRTGAVMHAQRVGLL